MGGHGSSRRARPFIEVLHDRDTCHGQRRGYRAIHLIEHLQGSSRSGASRRRPLSRAEPRKTVSTKIGISAIAIMRAPPTRRLVREDALNGMRLNIVRSTTGQRTLRSTSTKAIRKTAARASAIGLFVAVAPLVVDRAKFPAELIQAETG